MVLHSSSSSSLSSVNTDKRSTTYSSSNNGTALHKQIDDPSSYGSMLDQLHAEQKGTIEALTCQVEFYRNREERARQELVTLRRCLPLAKGDDNSASVAKLASENRTLGDELEALQAKKSAWDRDQTRLERQKKDLERQLKEAKHTLTGFSKAIEQLEIKMQRKEAEVQTRCLRLEQELGDKTHECEQLQQDKTTLQQQLENIQTASDENTRLRTELQALLHTADRGFSDNPKSSEFSSEIRSISDRLKFLEDTKIKQEAEIHHLQRQLSASAAELLTTQHEVERKNSEIKEMLLKLDNSTNVLTLREQMLASDDISKKEIEKQRQELSELVSILQREKSDLQSDLSRLNRELETTKNDLQSVKSRLSAKDHSLLVSTLRSEVTALKERIRVEFKHEQESLTAEVLSLKREITLLRGRLADKDVAARNLENELTRSEDKQKQMEYDIRQLKEQVCHFKTELEQSRNKYQQLQHCRTSLVEQLDSGFKELLKDEESAASAHEELERLRNELNLMTKKNVGFETERMALTEELEHIDRIHREFSTHQNEKLSDLYRQLVEKEEIITSLKSSERLVALLQAEKETWEGNVTDIRLRCENRVESEVRKADVLRSQVEQLEQERLSLKQQIGIFEEQRANLKEEKVTTELSLRQKDHELEELKCELTHLTNQLDATTQRLDNGRQEILTREQKLLEERKKLEHDMVYLMQRVESADQRNFELNEKVIVLAKQAKVDQTNLVALSCQMRKYKDQVKTLEIQLGQMHRCKGQNSQTFCDLQRKLKDVTCLKESYQVEIDKLRQMLEHVQSDYSVAKRQRDEAVKRIRLLVQCRDDMKVTVEDHTAELVEEIEALQHQMDSERKRCAVLLANEKTLLRDLQERNTAVMTLQRSLAVLQHQSNERSSESDRSSTSNTYRRQRSCCSCGTGSPVSSSNQSTSLTTSTLSPIHHHQHHAQSRSQQQHFLSSPEVSTDCTLTPTMEMKNLLSNLEHISKLSPQA
ncbi:uncharacterized protein PHALS_03723 [Plasmopara halstedii]|uniref:Uncharacterized protein n=1 Tax=Plasmopara halstedii TaxID=4781 RepID=A0A0P1AXQ4_PLAHL|nr:uncharacterized protein PHALS_03723 [Plasmopara halstedii]CEG47062.1 hypothetical protein PHALS_03723 [Plasmopara halstedii]|eukprot:XP_024583431.1 hypothetical protein PHALS_03723 [Plasmopara halstedii]